MTMAFKLYPHRPNGMNGMAGSAMASWTYNIFLPFETTYLCETAFSTLTNMKTNTDPGSSLKDLVCMCKEPSLIEVLTKQAHPSHRHWWFLAKSILLKACTLSSLRLLIQKAQLMLTNLRDAFRGKSRSPNIVPFHMLGIVSYCAIVTLCSRCALFRIFDFKNVMTLKSGSEVIERGHWHLRSLKVVSLPFDRLGFLLVFCSNFVPDIRLIRIPWPWNQG